MRPIKSIILILIIIYFSISVFQIGNYFINKHYKLYNGSVLLGRILPPTTIQGPHSITLFFENKHKALYYGTYGNALIGNYRDRFNRSDVKYFMLDSDTKSYLTKEFLGAYPNAKIIAAFKIGEPEQTVALYDRFPDKK